MAVSLDDLITGAYGNMIRTPEQMAARKQQIINATMPEYLRKFGATSQAQNEAAFGKGMGLSTWNAYQQALNTLMQNEGAANIENQAQSAVDQAQQAAVGQAAGYATAGANRSAQQNIAAGNQSVQRQLMKARGNQALLAGLIGGAGNAGAGAGGLLTKSFMSKPGSGTEPGALWGNLKANLSDLTGAPPAPEIGSAAGSSEMAANPGAYNAPSTNFSWDNAPAETSFPGVSFGNSGSDAGDMFGDLTYGGPGLDLGGLLASTYDPSVWSNF